MNAKDLLDFINAHFTMRANADCFNKLNHFVDSMRQNQYYPISDEEIHRGVEYKKAELKSIVKQIGMFFPNEDQCPAEVLIESFCNQSLQQFLDYKRLYEKSIR